MRTNKTEFEDLLDRCYTELATAYKEKYDVEQAERTAAMFLAAQMQLSLIIQDIEQTARSSKVEIERVEGEKYFEFKEAAVGKKLTENSLTALVAKDSAVIDAKRSNCEYEAELKKYNYLMSSIKEGHIFFRGMGRKNNWE